MYKKIQLVLFLFLPLWCTAQMDTKAKEESRHKFGVFYGMGFHRPIDYAAGVAENEAYLYSAERMKVIQFGMLYHFEILHGFGIRTGMHISLHFDGEQSLGVRGRADLPEYAKAYPTQGWEYSASRVSFPLHFGQRWKTNSFIDEVYIYAGPNFSSYVPLASVGISASISYYPNPSIPIYDAVVRYDESPNGDKLASSFKLEGTAGLQLEKSFSFGSLALGFEFLWGAENHGEMRYTVFPENTEWRNTGTYDYQRSYYAFNVAYYFPLE